MIKMVDGMPRLYLSQFTVDFLKSVGWTRIHQSELGDARLCGPYQMFSLQKRGIQEGRAVHVSALLGSAFHDVIARGVSNPSEDDWYESLSMALSRPRLLGEVKTQVPSYYIPMPDRTRVPLSERHLAVYAGRATQKMWGGISLSAIADTTIKFLQRRTAEVASIYAQVDKEVAVAAEIYVLETDLPSGIQLGGTIDWRIKSSNRKTGPWVSEEIDDIKTYGLWGPMLSPNGNVQGSTVNPGLDPQLLHYSLLSWLQSGMVPRLAAFALPVNLVPLKTGPRKGQPRGEFCKSMSISEGLLVHYANATLDFLESWAISRPRLFPTEKFSGGSFCAKCHHFAQCFDGQFGGLQSEPDVADDHGLDSTGDLYAEV